MQIIDTLIYRGQFQVRNAKSRPVRITPDGTAGIVYRGFVYPVYTAPDGSYYIDLSDTPWSKDPGTCPVARSLPPTTPSNRFFVHDKTSAQTAATELKYNREDGLSADSSRSSPELSASKRHARQLDTAPPRDDVSVPCSATLLKVSAEEARLVRSLDRYPALSVPLQGASTIDFFSSLLSQEKISNRLRNILRAARGHWNAPVMLSEFLEPTTGFRAFLFSRPNLGRKTRNELLTILSNLLIENRYVKIDSTKNKEDLDASPYESAANANSSAFQSADDREDALGIVREPTTIVTETLDVLSDRERDVAKRRYGLGGRRIDTLENIGADYGVTRERIRQIQARLLRKLRESTILSRSLKTHEVAIWNSISNNTGAIFCRELDKRWELLSPEVRVAIEAIYGSEQEWLESVSCSNAQGWFRDHTTLEIYRRAEESLKQEIREQRDPHPLYSISCPGLAATDLERLAVALGWQVYSGYVSARGIRRRIKRTIDLHLLLQQFSTCVVRLPTLLIEYHIRVPADCCRVRDARIVMEASPHLFLPITEEEWTAINCRSVTPGERIQVRERWREADKVIEDVDNDAVGESIAGALADILRNNGPLRLTDLHRKVVKRLGGATARSSIGPMLLTSGLFRRIAPGLYGLPDQSQAVAEGRYVPSALMADDQCRWYTAARWCGCTNIDFPAWNFSFEKELAEWARRNLATGPLLSSLMYVIQPKHWTISHREREYWERFQSRHARYELSQTPQPLTRFPPSLDRVLAATKKAIADGGTNWMRINRVVQRRIDFQGSVSVLAVLNLLGVVRAPGHWQKWHTVELEAGSVIKNAVEHLELNGMIHWDDPTGRDLLARATSRIRGDSTGWSTVRELESLLEVIANTGATDRENASIGNELPDPLMHARERSRRRRLAQVRQRMLEDDD